MSYEDKYKRLVEIDPLFAPKIHKNIDLLNFSESNNSSTNLDISITDFNKILFDNKINTNLFSYRCVMDPDVFSKQQIAKNTAGLQLANANLNNDKPTQDQNSDGSKYDDSKYYLYTNLADPSNNNKFFIS